MNHSISVWDVLFLLIFGLITLGIYWMFTRQQKGKASRGYAIQFNEEGIKVLNNIRQRCEYKDNLELVKYALASYDVLTDAIARGGKIKVEWEDGSSEPLDLFPIDDKD